MGDGGKDSRQMRLAPIDLKSINYPLIEPPSITSILLAINFIMPNQNRHLALYIYAGFVLEILSSRQWIGRTTTEIRATHPVGAALRVRLDVTEPHRHT
jgi:hypothetical protein